MTDIILNYNLTLLLLFVLSNTAFILGQSNSLSSNLTLTNEAEPGQKIVILGRIVDKKNNEKLSNVVIEVHQTDITGNYSAGGKNEKSPRLNGELISDKNGEFVINSIKPNSYPGTTFPKHIHFTIRKEGYQTKFTEMLFEDDKNLKSQDFRRDKKRGDFNLIRKIDKVENGIEYYSLFVGLEK